MKKFISFVVFAMLMVATCLSFAACGDDDDEEGGGGNSTTSPEKFKVIDPTAEDIEEFAFWGDNLESVNEGETKTYYIVCKKVNSETWYRPSGVTFSSNNDNVGFVEKKGEGIVVFTAKSTGKVTITAKLPGGNGSRSITITVIGKKPKTADEAGQMLLEKYWTTDDLDELPSDLTFKMKLASDGTVWHFYYVKAFPEPTTQWWKDYGGKTVAYTVGKYTLQPDKKDPTQGIIVYEYEKEGKIEAWKYRNLCATSFEQISTSELDEEEARWMHYTLTTRPSSVTYIKNPWK